MGLFSWVNLDYKHATRLGEKNLFITRIDEYKNRVMGKTQWYYL